MRVAITGGSGSLGRALISRLTKDGADRIVVFSRDEQKRLTMDADFGWHPGFRAYAGDVRDSERLPDILAGCEVVVHAAARKVVSGHHDEPREMLETNIRGTQNVMRAARVAGVRKLLFVSSDKAVAPINCYGTSKQMAEWLVVSENARSFASGLRCSVIRYGNVLASNGSVVRLWRERMAQGCPLPISDVRMTRFWLTLDQAADYVLKAIGDLRGGEVFVPALKAAPLIRLATAMLPDYDDDPVVGELTPESAPNWLVNMGIRPGGEKLHEELLSSDEIRRTVRRNGFYVVPPTRTAESWDASPWLGEPVPDDFTYRSDTWLGQWKVEELRDLIT